MGNEKKKWYQTGEFEDGYQFGDIFRTVKNAVNEKKDKAAANKIKKKAIVTNPKQERDDSKKNRYFQKGALENGDIDAAIKGTDRDIKTDLGAGFLSIGEKFIDWIATVAEADTEARMRQAQNDAIVHNAVWGGKQNEEEIIDKYEKMIQENKKQTADFIKGDLYNERDIANKIVAGYYAPNTAIKNKNFSVEGIKNAYKEEKDYIENDMEIDSVLAEKSDALAETTGHYIGQIVLSKVGVPWYLTAYTTAAGGEIENALNQGATFEEAVVSGMWSGGGEIASELIFGGPLSKTGLDDLLAKKVGSIFTNSFLKGLGKFGIKALGEGFEEPIASGIARFGQWLTYQDDKTLKEMLWSDEARQEYVDSFIGGIFLGSVGQGGEVIKSKAHGVDYVTGLTKSELKVVDEVYKDAVFEVTKSGKELTQKEKVQIYDNALQRVKSGEVDAQTVEEALGGEEYSAYKNALGNYNTLQQKLNEIKTADSNAKTQEQVAGEIEQRLEQVKLQADELKNILENKVAQKIDTDNIHLRDRESYLLDSYIKGIRKPIDNILDDTNLLKKIEEKAFVEGLWEDSPNSSKNIVEKSQLESVENFDESGIIEEKYLSNSKESIDNTDSVPGVYTKKIKWSIHKNLYVRPFGKGFFGIRIKQNNPRVDAYEMKINPNKESYYLQHSDGRYVQFENMVDNVLQDGKCVLNKKRSFYHVYDKGAFAKNRVLQQANRQIEAASAVGYKVEWLVSDEKAVAQLSRLFKENNVNITVKYYPE